MHRSTEDTSQFSKQKENEMTNAAVGTRVTTGYAWKIEYSCGCSLTGIQAGSIPPLTCPHESHEQAVQTVSEHPAVQTVEYPCGCKGTGTDGIPDYCPEHDTEARMFMPNKAGGTWTYDKPNRETPIKSAL